jgi:hypothetical protein
MTTQKKIDAILERLKLENTDINTPHISMMVIIQYLVQLEKTGVIECGFAMTPLGSAVASVCEEFDWKPTDQDVFRFVNDMVEEKERLAFAFMIKRWRDDREKLLQEIKEAKKQNSSE